MFEALATTGTINNGDNQQGDNQQRGQSAGDVTNSVNEVMLRNACH